MTDLAVAISVYDRFEDVRILTDIVRHNWPGRFRIFVCSSHPDAARQLSGAEIDDLLEVGKIPFDSSTADRQRTHLTMRVLDSLRTLGARCAESDAAFMLHLHADAYPLSWLKLEQLLGRIRRTGVAFAARGDGWGFYTSREPLGAFDDMFFLVDNRVAARERFWDFDLCDFLPHRINMHGALALLALTRLGLTRVLHYASNLELEYWDRQPVVQAPLNSSIPMSYHREFAFLHIHENAFPGDLGWQLKAHYLRSHHSTTGPALRTFLRHWNMSSEELMASLQSAEDTRRRFFARRGIGWLSLENFGRDCSAMDGAIAAYQESGLIARTRWLARRHVSQIRHRWLKPLRPRRRRTTMYPDMVWPDDLTAYYEEQLHPKALEVIGRDALPDDLPRSA